MQEVHYYARRFLAMGLNEEAFINYKHNYDRNPGEMVTNVGMARGYAAKGDYKKH